jgi:hypothetical protein
MAPLKILKNFKFKRFYPLSLPPQNEVGPSSSSPLFDDSPPIILFDYTQNNLSKQKKIKKKKLFEGS